VPHLKDGSEVKVGDRLKFPTQQQKRDSNGYEKVMREGLVYQINPGAQTCNAQVSYPYLEAFLGGDGQPSTHIVKLATTWVTLGECEPPG
jgi:hypothetical protein